MKKLFVLILSLTLIASYSLTAFAADKITVTLDGKELTFDVSPQIINGRTMVPLRIIFEALGYSVTYNNGIINAAKDGSAIEMTVGSVNMKINGADVAFDAAPVIIDGRTLVPVRAVAEGALTYVDWAADTKTVSITREDNSWKKNTGTINLTSMSVTGNGVAVSGKTISITSGGDFEVTGENLDTMIYVNTKEKVKLRLSGIKLKNTAGPAIFFDDTDKAFITITDGTQNYIEDGASYSVEAKGTLFSNDDLEIKGKGKLTIVSNYKHGIACDDKLSIENGSIKITSAGDGIHVNDELEITGGDIYIAAKSDAIECEGDVSISSGTVTIENIFGDSASAGVVKDEASSKGIKAANMEITVGDDKT
ncbi:MAG: carbohydrate-binding domain-containing protein [Bacillota bacterium]|nr:carbohydrate-binding domain-containing protein [Bacillota bacterium]